MTDELTLEQKSRLLELLQEKRKRRARVNFLEFCEYVGAPDWVTNWHHEVICEHIERWCRGEIKYLIVESHPRSGKSEIVSRNLPAYLFGAHEHTKIIAASFGAELASAFNRDVQRIIGSPAYRELYPHISLNDRNRVAVADGSWLRNNRTFEIVGTDMTYRCAGVGGSLTGSGGNCLRVGQKVSTPQGDVLIETIVPGDKVWSFNHATQRIEARRVTAVRTRTASQVVRVTMASGRRVVCTPEHPIFAQEQGYVEAALLQRGAKTLQLRGGMQSVRKKDRTPRRDAVPSVLYKTQRYSAHRALYDVQESVCDAALSLHGAAQTKGLWGMLQSGVQLWAPARSAKNTPMQALRPTSTAQKQAILFGCMQDAAARVSSQTMPCLRQGIPFGSEHALLGGVLSRVHPRQMPDVRQADQEAIYPQWRSALLRGVPTAQAEPSTYGAVRYVWQGLSDGRTQKDVLGGLLGQAAVPRYARKRPGRLHGLLFQAETPDKKQGQASLCGLWGAPGLHHRQAALRAPYRRGYAEQRADEPHYAVQVMPCDPPQHEGDAVSLVESLGEGEHKVVDIEVEKTHNFFTEGVLCHNCLILDDYHRNWEDAQSILKRTANWNWLRSVFLTRGSKDYKFIACVTRWHHDDILGRFLRAMEESNRMDEVVVLKFPAIQTKRSVYYDRRKEGQALWPEFFPLKVLRATQQLSPGIFEFLYQQNPTPREGMIVRPEWWKRWTKQTLPREFDLLCISADLTFDDKSRNSDYVVMQVWGRLDADKYLLAQVRDRMSFTRSLKVAVQLVQKYQPHKFIVEKAANGAAFIDTLKKHISGLVPVNPGSHSKATRLEAVAPQIEAGQVYIPDENMAGYDWVTGFLTEFAVFPGGTNDDQIDSAVYALQYMGASLFDISAFIPTSLSQQNVWEMPSREYG